MEILQRVFPQGVLQAVTGAGLAVPDAMVQHPQVKMVSLTGSTTSGVKVAGTASKTLTPTMLELGGKNAFVIFNDANVESAVKDTIDGTFFNKGEACTASSRIFVQKELYPEFVKRVTAAVQDLRSGDGPDETTHVEPVVSRQRHKQILSMIERGKQEGATLAAQGSVPTSNDLTDGFYDHQPYLQMSILAWQLPRRRYLVR